MTATGDPAVFFIDDDQQLIPLSLNLRFPRRDAENKSFRGIMTANEHVWTSGQN
jgi:hypothetical protein